MQDERYSYNSALTWYSYADWFYGEKTHEGTISFKRKGEFLDHMYADGCSYAICDYLERIGGGWDSEWTIEENLMYVGKNGYIAGAIARMEKRNFPFDRCLESLLCGD